jgi:quinol monooxygenase YgiN
VTVIVTATVHPEPGHLDAALAVFARHIGAIHQEPGCELYALHTHGEDLFVIEKWTTRAELDTHIKGPVLAALSAELDPLLARPADLAFLTPNAAGDPVKGAL